MHRENLVGALFTISLFIKLLLPPLQFILMLVYRGLYGFALPFYFTFYYVFVLISVLLLFLNLVFISALSSLFFILGGFFIVLSLLQAASEAFTLHGVLTLSTSLNLSLIFFLLALA
jgi:hypothetical protein